MYTLLSLSSYFSPFSLSGDRADNWRSRFTQTAVLFALFSFLREGRCSERGATGRIYEHINATLDGYSIPLHVLPRELVYSRANRFPSSRKRQTRTSIPFDRSSATNERRNDRKNSRLSARRARTIVIHNPIIRIERTCVSLVSSNPPLLTKSSPTISLAACLAKVVRDSFKTFENPRFIESSHVNAESRYNNAILTDRRIRARFMRRAASSDMTSGILGLIIIV